MDAIRSRFADDDLNVTALVKGTERYIWLWNNSQRAEVLCSFGRFAADPELSITWYDAACLCQRVRKDHPATK